MDFEELKMSKEVAKALASSAAGLPGISKTNETNPFGEEVRALRESLDLTQESFCKKFNIPLANLRNWEQRGRSTVPDSASRLLIGMIKVDPKRVEELVAKTMARESGPESETKVAISK